VRGALRTPAFLPLVLLAARLAAAPPDPAPAFHRAVQAAEARLRAGDLPGARERYAAALLEGWLVLGALEAADGRGAEARAAFAAAAAAAPDDPRAARALAFEAVRAGDGAAALGALETARRLAPGDLEIAYALGAELVRAGRRAEAERLFAELVAARPLPQTHILVGRTWRDGGDYARARASLQAALALDPRARRAHFYLGTIAMLEDNTVALDTAIGHFEQELEVAPGDPLASLHLGMALMEARRAAEALPHLEAAARAEAPPPHAFYYLGRARVALDRAAEAIEPLRRALAMAEAGGATDAHFGAIHYQLGLASRKLGRTEDAAAHFAAAERYSGRTTAGQRERMARYLAGDAEADADARRNTAVVVGATPADGLAGPAREEARRRVAAALAGAYLNLGIMLAQTGQFAEAAEDLRRAAALDPESPRIQYSLGVARFNAGQFAAATEPLRRALAAAPGDAALRRMLALASLNAGGYKEAADLLASDPQRDADPALQYAYGLSLVRSGRAAEAHALFGRLLAQHGDSAELSVGIGEAFFQQDDYPSAVEALTRALRLKPDVAGASGTLGVLYLRQGKLPEAEAALRAELRSHPGDLRSRQHLAIVLELQDKAEEAIPLLRAVLEAQPDSAEALYLLGKMVLARGDAAEALAHLETAARLDPGSANVRYQLGRAYQKLGRTAEAEQQFEKFRQLKDATR
jgi:tetratricopeptide (TPR) repeat protein